MENYVPHTLANFIMSKKYICEEESELRRVIKVQSLTIKKLKSNKEINKYEKNLTRLDGYTEQK